MDYEKDMEIDDSALDVECLNQPMLMAKYSKECAKCELDRDHAKESLELIKAELDNKIRGNPSKYGIEKVTESVVNAIILQQQVYKEANEEYLQAKYEFNVAKGVVDAVEQRKAMLEAMIKLLGQNYFAGPASPRDLSWEKEERQNRVNAKIAEARKSRRTK